MKFLKTLSKKKEKDLFTYFPNDKFRGIGVFGSPSSGRQIYSSDSIYEWHKFYKGFIDDCWNRYNPCRNQINILISIIRGNSITSLNFKSVKDPIISLIIFESQLSSLCNFFEEYSLKVLYMPSGMALSFAGDMMAFDFYNNPNLSDKDIYIQILNEYLYR